MNEIRVSFDDLIALMKRNSDLERQLGEVKAELKERDGWIEWSGGECPVEDGQRVEVKFRRGNGVVADMPQYLFWGKIDNYSQGEIVAYRVLHERDERQKAAEEMAAELEKKSAAVERMGRRIQRLEAEKRVKSSDATESSESLREVILDVVAESPGMNLPYVTQRVRAEQILSGKVMPGTLRIHRAIHGMVAEGVLSKVIGGFYPTEHMWIKWKGGKCPVDREQKVKVLFRNNGRCTAPASHFRWMHEDREDDITGYMLVEIETAVL